MPLNKLFPKISQLPIHQNVILLYLFHQSLLQFLLPQSHQILSSDQLRLTIMYLLLQLILPQVIRPLLEHERPDHLSFVTRALSSQFL